MHCKQSWMPEHVLFFARQRVLATMVPEFAQLAILYYSSSAANHQHRAKRFLFNDQTSRDGGSKGTVLDQMVANAFKDVNYTKVALLLFHNNESLAKIRQNVNPDVIVRALMREIDYEQFGQSLWYALESEFNLERFIHSILNITHIDIIYEDIVTNGTVPDWFVKSIHPDVDTHAVNRMLASLKNFTGQAFSVMSSSAKLDEFLFKMVQDKLLKPFATVIQRVKQEKPATLDQLVEIILSNLNRVINVRERRSFCCRWDRPLLIPFRNNLRRRRQDQRHWHRRKQLLESQCQTTAVPISGNTDVSDDLRLLFYQCSVLIHSVGQTVRVALKSVEQLYCTSIWEVISSKHSIEHDFRLFLLHRNCVAC